MKEWIHELFDFFFPRFCVMCEKRLYPHEKTLCIACFRDLPRTDFHFERENELEKLFYGKIPIERACSFFYYRKGNLACNILYHLKYYNHPLVGIEMGRCYATEILSSGFFENIDCIVPVPLAVAKKRKRGYNQSEWLARGISQITDIPIETNAVRRLQNTETQTHKGAEERLKNVSEAFQKVSSVDLSGKHILLIDDVVTTGATLSACAYAILKGDNPKISILTLAFASQL